MKSRSIEKEFCKKRLEYKTKTFTSFLFGIQKRAETGALRCESAELLMPSDW